MMPRDLELIRQLMLQFERDDTSIPAVRTKEEVAYHVNQMVQSGLIDAEIIRSPSPGKMKPSDFIFSDITPAGHDFIAALRSEGFWAKVKQEASEKYLPLTFDILIEFTKTEIKRRFFQHG